MQWLLRFASGDTGDTIDPTTVTPGVIGFILTVAIAVVVVFLVIDMTRRIRRINYRAMVNEKLDAEEAAEGTPKD